MIWDIKASFNSSNQDASLVATQRLNKVVPESSTWIQNKIKEQFEEELSKRNKKIGYLESVNKSLEVQVKTYESESKQENDSKAILF